MSSSDECNRSGGENTPSPKICEFSDDNLNIDIDILISEVQSIFDFSVYFLFFLLVNYNPYKELQCYPLQYLEIYYY